MALGVAVGKAIDHADALSKAAQKAGVTAEALSRLAYAASFSEVSLDEVTASLGKLSKTMADATQNAHGSAASAFAALGISVTDASGKLRTADAVFSDIADRFSRIPDGATKTALSMALFGKSGAQLIPVLNEGADGLKRFADESDRTGNTISTKTANAANKFNDTMALIGKAFDGVVNKITEAALPALQSLADTLADPKFQQAAAQLATWIIQAMNAVIEVVGGAARAIDDLIKKITSAAGAGGDGNGTVEINKQIAAWKAYGDAATDAISKARAANEIAALQAKLAKPSGPWTGGQTGTWGNMGSDSPGLKGNGAGINTNLFTGGSFGKVAETIDPFAARINDLSAALTATVDPFSQMKTDLTDLQTMFDHGRISASQFGDAVVKTAAGGVGAIADLAGGLSGALSQMFKENKAIAVANAIVNGIGSVAKTFETYGATPWGFAAAGIAAATAAANVASILSTNENSTSAAAGSTGTAAAAPQQGSAINLTVRGSGMISVDDLVNQLTQSISDGGSQALVKVIKAA